MSEKNLKVYFVDIINSIEKVEAYIGSMSLEQFRQDEKTQDAVIKNFEIIGEASKRIPEEIKKTHPEVPWRSAGDMRDFLIHDYPNIVPDVVWKTAKDDLPIFKKQIADILKNI